MVTFKKFMNKPKFIQAVHYDGSDAMREEIIAMFPKDTQTERTQRGVITGSIMVGKELEAITTLYANSWLIQLPDGRLNTMKDELFQATFDDAESYDLGMRLVAAGVGIEEPVDAVEALITKAADKIETGAVDLEKKGEKILGLGSEGSPDKTN
jgi:hypothetical protein